MRQKVGMKCNPKKLRLSQKNEANEAGGRWLQPLEGVDLRLRIAVLEVS